jgi:hypothetical protein
MISPFFLAGQKLPGRFLGFGNRCHGSGIRRVCSRPFSGSHFGLLKLRGGCVLSRRSAAMGGEFYG